MHDAIIVISFVVKLTISKGIDSFYSIILTLKYILHVLDEPIAEASNGCNSDLATVTSGTVTGSYLVTSLTIFYCRL